MHSDIKKNNEQNFKLLKYYHLIVNNTGIDTIYLL